MDVWISVLSFILFLAYAISTMLCISAIRRKSEIVIASRIHHKVTGYEIIIANLCLIGAVVMVAFHYYTFMPAVICIVLDIILQTKIESGLTEEGALIDTSFIEWEFMKSYKLVYDPEDDSTITLKIRANRKQYVLICDREDKKEIEKIFNGNKVKVTETIKD